MEEAVERAWYFGVRHFGYLHKDLEVQSIDRVTEADLII